MGVNKININNNDSNYAHSIFDISEYTGKTYDTLSDALADIPDGKQKGGMTVSFVSTSDNKYVQYRLMADEWSVDTEDWAIADEGVYVENPEFVYVKTDAEGKILWAIRTDGDIFYGVGVPSQVVNYINEKIAELSLDEYEDIVAFLNGLEEGDKTLQTLLNEKVDKEEGKSLIDAEYASSQSVIENPEWLDVITDNENKVICGIKKNGQFVWAKGIPEHILKEIDSRIDSRYKFYNKNIVCLGDSITSFTYNNKSYTDYIQELSKANVINAGSGGATIALRGELTTNPTTEGEAARALDIYSAVKAWTEHDFTYVDAAVTWLNEHQINRHSNTQNLKNINIGDTDIVVLFGGTNDYAGNIPTGDIDSTNPLETCGALNEIISMLLTSNPKLKIYVFTPIVRYLSGAREEQYWCDNYIRTDGKYLSDEVNIILETAKRNHITAFDIYNTLGWNQTNFSNYFIDGDNTHPYKGFDYLAAKIYSLLLSDVGTLPNLNDGNGEELLSPSLYMLGDLNSEFNPPFPMSVVGNKGDASCKYTLVVPLKDNFNIRFKVKLTQNLFVTTGSTTKSVFSINGNNVNVAYVRYVQKTVTYEYQGVSKTSYYPTLNGGLSFLDSGTSAREDANHNRGTFAFSIKYIGNGSDVKISNNGTQLSIDVDGTITTFAFSTYTTVYDLYSALKNLSDFEVDYNDIEGHNSTELAKFVDVRLISTYYSNITGNPTGTKEEYTDSAPLFIPYAMDNKWHQVEIIRSSGLLYLTVDGLVKTPITIDMPDVSTLIFGGNVGALYKDLEIDTSTCRDAEIIENVTGGRRIASEINPYIIIYEGHGMQDVPNDDVPIDEMTCSPERIQSIVDIASSKSYSSVKLTDIVDYFDGKKKLPKKCFTMIFDDYRFENVMNLKYRSVFTRNGIDAALAIISSREESITYNGETITMDKAVSICKNAGFDCFSHTRSHRSVTAYRPSEYINETQLDIYDGDEKGINPNILIYPFGDTNQYEIDCLEWAGIKAAINVDYNSALYAGTSKYNIPRRELGAREIWENIIKEIK